MHTWSFAPSVVGDCGAQDTTDIGHDVRVQRHGLEYSQARWWPRFGQHRQPVEMEAGFLV